MTGDLAGIVAGSIDAAEGDRPAVRSGVDVVSIDRVAALLGEFGGSFRDRAFDDAEQAYCESRASPPQHYAARWAAKEAFVKAVDDGAPPVRFREVGIRREGAEPRLAPSGTAERALRRTLPGQTGTAVSLSHDREAGTAVAHVVLVARAGGESG